MRIGWLGLGAMGAPMASCLARAGHDVAGYDVVPGRAAGLAAGGLRAADTIAAAARDADLVAVMVATPEQLDQVLSSLMGRPGPDGPDGPDGSDGPDRPDGAPALAPGTIVMIMATVGPEAVAAAAGRLAGQAVVDAPVSGGVARAAAGDLLIMVSGPPDAVRRIQPVLDALARNAPVVGASPGDGQRMKLVNQLLCGVHIAAAAEALAFAGALGLDPAECWRVLRGGAAASFMFEDRGARMAEGQFGEVRSALDIFVKDMGLVGAAADEAGAWVPLTAAARELYARGHDLGLGRLDDSALIEVLRPGRPSGSE
jgi:3-hydroxyisobutyrate dehydrogenase/putative dehydrogenase